MEDFFKFLEKKPLYYKKIDTNRIKIAYNILKNKISSPKTVHLIGTNGKGSTGRALAHLAFKANLNVGHYSSPHILNFNERIWINGKNIDNELLQKNHLKLLKILGKKISNELSYFEYTTLLAVLIFEKLDLIVLEAGLGGEMDATTQIENRILSIVTPIGFDHQEFLGDSIKKIATTKLKSIQKEALLAPQRYPEVLEVAKELSKKRNFKLHLLEKFEEKKEQIKKVVAKKAYPEFLISNFAVATKALDILGIKYSLNDLKTLEIFGRFYKIAPNVRIDVGHNLLSAKAIFEAMEENTILIYNSLKDKNYHKILKLLKPKIKEVKIIKIDTPRAVKIEDLRKSLEALDILYEDFDGNLNPKENYLVFGSFYTVEAFLKMLNYSS
jgi:dihydrofolate synthase/folylpolyglutamate synthase